MKSKHLVLVIIVLTALVFVLAVQGGSVSNLFNNQSTNTQVERKFITQEDLALTPAPTPTIPMVGNLKQVLDEGVETDTTKSVYSNELLLDFVGVVYPSRIGEGNFMVYGYVKAISKSELSLDLMTENNLKLPLTEGVKVTTFPGNLTIYPSLDEIKDKVVMITIADINVQDKVRVLLDSKTGVVTHLHKLID